MATAELDSASTQIYPVPIIYQSLRKPEAYLQSFDALEHLDRVIDDAFARISTRISYEKSRLQHLGARLGVAQSKVQQIQGRTKATTVFSPNKYPAPAQASDYTPLFGEASAATGAIKRSNYKLTETSFSPNFEQSPITPDSLTKEVTIADKDTSKEGIGRIPETVTSLSSLLLFNTAENPYKKYNNLDNLLGKAPTKKDDGKTAKKELTEAPKTFSEGDTLPAVATIEYNYRPVLGDVPTMELPSALPLPNVAEVTWTISTISSIAPSVPLPDLPAVEPTKEEVSSSSATSTSAPPPPPSSFSGPPPPPAPPGPPPPPSSSGPAPPPPPPPSSAPPPPPPPAPVKIDPAKAPADAPAPDEGRSGLLADIRKGHMSRLKSVKKRKIKEKKVEAKPAEGGDEGGGDGGKKKLAPMQSTGDIFGDLLQALNRRRKGIAEKQEKAATIAEENEIEAPPSNPSDWAP